MVFACHILLFTVSVHYFLKIKLLWESFCLNILSFVNCSHKKFVWGFFGGGGWRGVCFCVAFRSFIFIFIFGGGGLFLESSEVVFTGKVSLGIGLFAYYYKLFT